MSAAASGVAAARPPSAARNSWTRSGSLRLSARILSIQALFSRSRAARYSAACGSIGGASIGGGSVPAPRRGITRLRIASGSSQTSSDGWAVVVAALIDHSPACWLGVPDCSERS
ncbi:hypothetical protein KGQ20_17895 [Catenulispora sp. NF23]|uniref:Uncharacterized protein n=1 Tax=Catenulispora pinistramenti TaxID=2705254 RepID=A0ABS5KSN3_9ACTN|nr:hypothetical protein [Catenulispora pinistramenti]MBS2534647.1 hypothetical protein [Catenulispora pinistramenti]MBS2549058.1 hypothetical protein [Catenulispora pinistramenti]